MLNEGGVEIKVSEKQTEAASCERAACWLFLTSVGLS